MGMDGMRGAGHRVHPRPLCTARFLLAARAKPVELRLRQLMQAREGERQ